MAACRHLTLFIPFSIKNRITVNITAMTMDHDHNQDEVPNHRIADSLVLNDYTTLTVISNNHLFTIHLNRADLHGTPLEPQYSHRLEQFTSNEDIIAPDEDLPDDGEQFDDFCDWIIQPCAAQMRRLAPELQGGREITLQQFAFVPSHCLKLVPDGNGSGRLTAVHVQDSSFKHSLSTEPVEKLCLPPSSSTRRISATQALIYPEPNTNYEYTCDIPSRVYVAGQEKFFKPITLPGEFKQEVMKLHRMVELNLPGHINVPELFGIVVLNDGVSVIGMLLDWMPFGSRTLWKTEFRQMKDMHAKWEAQAIGIVKEPHAVDMVWGDVNPGNMVIDFDLNVWVVDFGGGFIEESVDRRSAGTKEGDLEGIKRIFRWIQSNI